MALWWPYAVRENRSQVVYWWDDKPPALSKYAPRNLGAENHPQQELRDMCAKEATVDEEFR
jgi:hypothetical protein